MNRVDDDLTLFCEGWFVFGIGGHHFVVRRLLQIKAGSEFRIFISKCKYLKIESES